MLITNITILWLLIGLGFVHMNHPWAASIFFVSAAAMSTTLAIMFLHSDWRGKTIFAVKSWFFVLLSVLYFNNDLISFCTPTKPFTKLKLSLTVGGAVLILAVSIMVDIVVDWRNNKQEKQEQA